MSTERTELEEIVESLAPAGLQVWGPNGELAGEEAGSELPEDLLTPEEMQELLQSLTFVRRSKHRAGRTKPLTKKQRTRRNARSRKAEQASKSLHLKYQHVLRELLKEHEKDREAIERALRTERETRE